MGFKQLASLRDQLAQQAASQKSTKRQNHKGTDKPTKTTRKVDPLVLIIGQLQNRFPLAFPKKPTPKVPLKIGIHKDILEQTDQLGINKDQLLAAIKVWCWGNRYWECLLENAPRIDLNGQASGQVTKADSVRAGKLLEKRQKKTKDISASPSKHILP